MDRELTLELVRVTEAAALAAAPLAGRGNADEADGAAVAAMRAALDTIDFEGVVTIGEGGMDEAPRRDSGEGVGRGARRAAAEGGASAGVGHHAAVEVV